jgi:hypothetical protein
VVTRKWKWLQDLKQEREQDINIEATGKMTRVEIIEIRNILSPLLIANKLSRTKLLY